MALSSEPSIELVLKFAEIGALSALGLFALTVAVFAICVEYVEDAEETIKRQLNLSIRRQQGELDPNEATSDLATQISSRMKQLERDQLALKEFERSRNRLTVKNTVVMPGWFLLIAFGLFLAAYTAASLLKTRGIEVGAALLVLGAAFSLASVIRQLLPALVWVEEVIRKAKSQAPFEAYFETPEGQTDRLSILRQPRNGPVRIVFEHFDKSTIRNAHLRLYFPPSLVVKLPDAPKTWTVRETRRPDLPGWRFWFDRKEVWQPAAPWRWNLAVSELTKGRDHKVLVVVYDDSGPLFERELHILGSGS